MNPIHDPFMSLFKKPFSCWNEFNKNDLLKQGKPTPYSTCLTTDKVFRRSFSVNWYIQNSWLCGSYNIQKLFCWHCLLLGKTKCVCTTGYCDFKKLP